MFNPFLLEPSFIRYHQKSFYWIKQVLISGQIGYTCIILLLEVLIADVTSSRSRLLFSFVPALPFVVSFFSFFFFLSLEKIDREHQIEGKTNSGIFDRSILGLVVI